MPKGLYENLQVFWHVKMNNIKKNTRLVYWGITDTKMSSDVNWRVFSIYFIKGIPGLHGQPLKWWPLSTCMIICLGVVLQNCILNEVKGNVLSAQKQTIHKVMLTHPHNFDKSPYLPFFETSNKFHNFYQVVQFWPNFRILKFRFSCYDLWECAKTRPQVLSEIISLNLTCNIFLNVETSSLRCYLALIGRLINQRGIVRHFIKVN